MLRIELSRKRPEKRRYEEAPELQKNTIIGRLEYMRDSFVEWAQENNLAPPEVFANMAIYTQEAIDYIVGYEPCQDNANERSE